MITDVKIKQNTFKYEKIICRREKRSIGKKKHINSKKKHRNMYFFGIFGTIKRKQKSNKAGPDQRDGEEGCRPAPGGRFQPEQFILISKREHPLEHPVLHYMLLMVLVRGRGRRGCFLTF